jgi:hypothetical protein
LGGGLGGVHARLGSIPDPSSSGLSSRPDSSSGGLSRIHRPLPSSSEGIEASLPASLSGAPTRSASAFVGICNTAPSPKFIHYSLMATIGSVGCATESGSTSADPQSRANTHTAFIINLDIATTGIPHQGEFRDPLAASRQLTKHGLEIFHSVSSVVKILHKNSFQKKRGRTQQFPTSSFLLHTFP